MFDMLVRLHAFWTCLENDSLRNCEAEMTSFGFIIRRGISVRSFRVALWTRYNWISNTHPNRDDMRRTRHIVHE